MNKVTNKEKFEMIREMAEKAGNQIIVEFAEANIERLQNKKTAPTKAQKANMELANVAYDALAAIGVPVTISDLMKDAAAQELETAIVKAGGNFSNQKVTALMKVLVNDKRVVKTEDKKKTLYSIAQ